LIINLLRRIHTGISANGIAVLTSSPEKANSGEFQFEVTGVALVGYTDATDYTDTSVTTASVTFP
jgi:hypothetical protein